MARIDGLCRDRNGLVMHRKRRAKHGKHRSLRNEERLPRGFHVVCTQEFSVAQTNLWYEALENEQEQDVLKSCFNNGQPVWCVASVG